MMDAVVHATDTGTTTIIGKYQIRIALFIVGFCFPWIKSDLQITFTVTYKLQFVICWYSFKNL